MSGQCKPVSEQLDLGKVVFQQSDLHTTRTAVVLLNVSVQKSASKPAHPRLIQARMAAIGFGAKKERQHRSDVAVNPLEHFRSMVLADQPASESDVMR